MMPDSAGDDWIKETLARAMLGGSNRPENSSDTNQSTESPANDDVSPAVESTPVESARIESTPVESARIGSTPAESAPVPAEAEPVRAETAPEPSQPKALDFGGRSESMVVSTSRPNGNGGASYAERLSETFAMPSSESAPISPAASLGSGIEPKAPRSAATTLVDLPPVSSIDDDPTGVLAADLKDSEFERVSLDDDDNDNDEESSFVRGLVEWLVVLVGAVLVALILRTFLFQAFWIPSESMEVTLLKQDRVLVNKLSYRLHEVNRGDVVVFRRPDEEQAEIRDLIKRVIGLPGETVEGRDNAIFVDGNKLIEPYLDPSEVISEFGPVTVPEGEMFVMGDNRDESYDSRFFGTVAEDRIVGRAFVLFWPLNRIGTL